MANVVIPTNAVDFDGIGDLRRRAERDDPTALADVAVQFEALFIGMMLDSARSAGLGSGAFDGPETEQYLSLMDAQVALELARGGGFGFAKILTEQVAGRGGADRTGGFAAVMGMLTRAPAATAQTAAVPSTELAEADAALVPPPPGAVSSEFPSGLPTSLAALGGAVPAGDDGAPTPAEFVTALLPEAQVAAAALGVEPKLLLAQAALETGWGRAVPQRSASESANNLFGIKAGEAWSGAAVEHWTVEHVDGAAENVRAPFRSYGSAAESFADYVSLIGSSRRYAGALESAENPEAYARAVTKAGYATDPAYADKWLAIYHGDRLTQALRGLDLPAARTLATE